MRLDFLVPFLVLLSEGTTQLVHSEVDHTQTPVVGPNKGTRCYDQFNRAQRCIPEFENAAFNQEMEATNTCGENGEQEYCVQTGVTGIRKSCSVCFSGQHHARYLTDLHNVDNPTWWQSESMLEGIQWQDYAEDGHPTGQVNLTLRFGKSFDITYIRLWFQSPRPESFRIWKRTTENSSWVPFQYYSATCRDTYGIPDQPYTSKGEETRALCTSEYSDISPLRGGNVAFGTLEGRPSAYNFEGSPELQEWVTATEIKITLDRLNTFGDEVFGDPQVLRSYFYAIADVAVGARCKCNGHASECVESMDGTRRRVCKCEHNTMGPDCNECLPFYNDAPWARAMAQNANECKQCNCNGYSERCVFDQKLYELTGHGGHCLDCRSNRDGANCEKCRPNYYMKEDGFCEPCNCDETGSLFQQCNSQGKCQCKDGVTGDKCDRCSENHFDFTLKGCKSCECSEQGSAFNTATCNPDNGVCQCKENVEGKQCRECKPGYFNLDLENEFGCTPCFCYGHSSKCRSASGYSKYTLESSFAKGNEKWRAEDQYGRIVPIKYEAISQSIGVQAQNEDVYFLAPDRFLGDQRASYNQLLEFAFRIGETRSMPTATDIILEGNGRKITNTIFAQENLYPSIHTQTYKFRLHEHPDFQWQPRLSSRDFISILTNLTAIKIRGTYSPLGVGFLDDVKLETASRGAAGQSALWMEFCDCPMGYVGQFCESCAPGFRHSPAHGGPFTSCIPCDCNNHASICESETGRCICKDHTAGDNCELCARGFYGNALMGTAEDCLPCNCPDGGACIQLEDDVIMCTECPTGYSGHRCDVCSDGFHGDPTGRFGTSTPCQPCDCNDNIDTNAIGNCNTTTGQCLRCIHNTAGSNCDVCLPGFYGNALVLPKGDCKKCECFPLGTEQENDEPICNPSTGTCLCKEHVTGRNCDQCEVGFYNLAGGEGCQNCNCDPVGAYNQSCDVFTGQCHCRPGVTGLRCDHCEARKYGFSLEGCKDCECDLIGSKDLQCDANGQCPCLDNVEGRRCDRCKENKYDRHQGCIDCPECYNLVQTAYRSHNNKLQRLNDILNEIERRPTVIADEEFPAELSKLQDDIDDLSDKVREATGEESILHQVQDIRKREKDISRTLETVKENVEGIEDKIAEVERTTDKTDDILEDVKTTLNDLTTNFETDAKKSLLDAWERSKQVGQQSDNMTKIAQEAREIADLLEEQADSLVDNAKEAKNKSSEVYELAKKANADQTLMRDSAHKLKAEIDLTESRLGRSQEYTKEVNEKARKVKNEAVELLNEINNLLIPNVDVSDLSTRSNKFRKQAEEMRERADGLYNNSKDLRDLIDQKNLEGDQLLHQADDQQLILNELVDEIHEANDTVVKTITKWLEKLNEAEKIYNDLKSSDSDTQKLRMEAEEALKTIPKIEEIIYDTLKRMNDAQKQLVSISDQAGEALITAQDAKKEEEGASEELKGLLEEAKKLDKETDKLVEENGQIDGQVGEAEHKLDQLLHLPISDASVVNEAKESVGQAGQQTANVSDQVTKLLQSVKEIMDELENSPDIDEDTLDRLDRDMQLIEQRINETRLEEQLEQLQDKHKMQNGLIADYKQQIEKMTGEVENIKHIVQALPQGCFRSVALEP